MKDSGPPVRGRFRLAVTCAITMYACAAVYGAYFVFTGSSRPTHFLAIVLGLPAIAACLFILTAANVPGLLAPGRLVFPLNLTLPPVFAAFLILLVLLLTKTDSGLIVPFEKLRAVQFWTSKEVLTVVTLSQIICLTALTKLKGEPVD